MEKSKKLGVVIPYRNRRSHLKEFSRRFVRYMEKFDINYELIVINQDDAKLFNRGMLLNIGFKYAEQLNCDYVVFHDVDMIPIHVDYSYSEVPLHLSTHFLKTEGYDDKETFDQYFGGVTMFTMDDFRKVDGYSNKYWGWGYEDTDLLYRCEKNAIKLEKIKIEHVGTPCQSLKFNGINSYVKGKNIFNINENNTFFISFFPDEIELDHTKDVDDFNVFTIPGYDFTISYNSFMRYNFCTFDVENNALYVNSKIKTNYKTNICVTINNVNSQIKVYQDGNLIGDCYYHEKLHSYNEEEFFYIGVGNPNRYNPANGEYPKFYKGSVTLFANFNCVLSDSEIKELSKNENFNFNQDFGDYHSSTYLKTYYDTKNIKNYTLTDLSTSGNDGEIINCEVVNLSFTKYKTIRTPFRRESTFALLHHKENGFYKNKWKFKATRWNQLRFFNEVCKDNNLLKNDGLSTLEFVEHGLIKITENITHVNVGI